MTAIEILELALSDSNIKMEFFERGVSEAELEKALADLEELKYLKDKLKGKLNV